ncbi:MOSC domain-containing protein [Thalassorhabdomicrobium marinisediminis]|uniref:Molybdenum cofactor biosysynthesis protein n=1 Tax=Thalassorhabdomicrobium marinisediminis TaxID=2170577 RepID=A0A2T7FWB4_9RHOB|nr:MOSC N-terminal beta barrel domain-containing protein [Thalassorhabdomicrobium marinisediminis]PVA06465.1 molybdenum cofactor biosysynthesis protein [Thalassorhabdomicrobium marinisediminis]
MGTVAQIWRHPIKSHGREAIDATHLAAGKCLPWDRHWAVVHERTKFDGENWAMCRNFMIGTLTPTLAGIWAELDEATGRLTLRHQDIGSVTFDPDTEEHLFLDWVTPLCPPERDMPAAIVKAEGRGMTDSAFPSISLMNRTSHAAVEQAHGAPLEQERWRGNIWLDGLAPWAEEQWIGKTIRIGGATLEVREPIRRCLHTAANPASGDRDVDTISVLKTGFGHQNFGVYAVVTQDGPVAVGDAAEVL